LLLIFGWVEQVLFFCAHTISLHRFLPFAHLISWWSLTVWEV